MTTQYESIEALLTVRRYLYGLFQSIFGNEPAKEQIQALFSEPTRDALALYFDGDSESLSAQNSLFSALKQKLETDEKSMLECLKSEYNRLFIGPGQLPAPPWESVYRTKERLIFQESTLKVRRRYLEYQFLPARYPSEADDHIALELDFITNLSDLALQYLDENDMERVWKILKDQKSFLADHLLIWIPDFAHDIQDSTTNHLYPALAVVLHKFLELDSAALDELFDLAKE